MYSIRLMLPCSKSQASARCCMLNGSSDQVIWNTSSMSCFTQIIEVRLHPIELHIYCQAKVLHHYHSLTLNIASSNAMQTLHECHIDFSIWCRPSLASLSPSLMGQLVSHSFLIFVFGRFMRNDFRAIFDLSVSASIYINAIFSCHF